MNNISLLNQYAINYLSKYNSTKKNLERVLKNNVMRMNNLKKSDKINLFKAINKIIERIESKRIINEKNFAETKITALFHRGKSENFIKNSLFKKGVDNNLINKTLTNFKNINPEWESKSARTFARKKRLGKFGNLSSKERDLAKMARAGFKYKIALEALGYN